MAEISFTTLCYIEKENQYLMMHRVKKQNDLNKDKWVGIGGHFMEGETPEECLLREVKEETNLSIRLREGFRESVEYFPKPYIKKQVVYFLGLSLGDPPKRQEEEISELRWVPIDDAERMVSFANDKNLISRSREYLKINGPE